MILEPLLLENGPGEFVSTALTWAAVCLLLGLEDSGCSARVCHSSEGISSKTWGVFEELLKSRGPGVAGGVLVAQDIANDSAQ